MHKDKGKTVDQLMANGFGWLIKVNIASMCGEYEPHYWGCACPIEWIHPAYGIEAIKKHGNFDRSGKVVLAMANTVEDLQDKLLLFCLKEWPE